MNQNSYRPEGRWVEQTKHWHLIGPCHVNKLDLALPLAIFGGLSIDVT